MKLLLSVLDRPDGLCMVRKEREKIYLEKIKPKKNKNSRRRSANPQRHKPRTCSTVRNPYFPVSLSVLFAYVRDCGCCIWNEPESCSFDVQNEHISKQIEDGDD